MQFSNLLIFLSFIVRRPISGFPDTMFIRSISKKSRFGCRYFATLTFSDLPGLFIEEEYLDKDLHEKVFVETRLASTLANELAHQSKQTFVSPAHNIPIRSEYVPVKVPLRGFYSSKSSCTPKLSAEHFSHYGEGHRLTYYRGNDNIPQLELPDDFLGKMSSIKGIENELEGSRSLSEPPKWRLTLNHYPAPSTHQSDKEKPVRAGFPWHRDLEANGASSMILGLGSPGRLEFGKEPNSQPPPADNRVERPDLVEAVRSIELQPGSLLILTGPARWHLVHRVLNCTQGEERASLVFGVW